MTFGLLGSILFNLDVEQWSSPEDLCRYAEAGMNPEYNFVMFLTIFGLLVPASIALLSISWILEDSGLVHYSFKEGDFYEIEPIHNKYGSYLKGYAGISSLIFVFKFALEASNQGNLFDMALVLVAIIMALFCVIPTLMVYKKVLKDKSFIQKGLSKVRILSEEDLKIGRDN
ncbi:MAG: hypothetical protein GF364_20585 [Candidatus Lokiarchaeota archaeon]|nr:hypothetical protein [Candidatus Lokiarchaeota archaeon]